MVHNYFFQLRKDQEKGAAALLLTVILLAGILVLGLAVAMVMLSEIKLSRGSSDSVIAYFVADSAAEIALYNIRSDVSGWRPSDGDVSGFIDDMLPDLTNANYRIDVDFQAGGQVSITTEGSYLTTARTVKVGW